jgi:hypothetical protein
MPVLEHDRKAKYGVPTGDVIVGIAWLVFYGTLTFVGWSRGYQSLMAAIDLSGLQ